MKRTKKRKQRATKIKKVDSLEQKGIIIENTDDPTPEAIKIEHTDNPTQETTEIEHTDNPTQETMEIENTDNPIPEAIKIEHTDSLTQKAMENENTVNPMPQAIKLENTDNPTPETVKIENTDNPTPEAVKIEYTDNPIQIAIKSENTDKLKQKAIVKLTKLEDITFEEIRRLIKETKIKQNNEDSSEESNRGRKKNKDNNKDGYRRSGRVRKNIFEKLDYGDDETDSDDQNKSSKQNGRIQPDSSEEDEASFRDMYYRERRFRNREVVVKRNLRTRKDKAKVDSDSESGSDSNTTEKKKMSDSEPDSTDWELSDNENYNSSKINKNLPKSKKRSSKVKTKIGTGRQSCVDGNNEYCQECKKGGHLLCCDTCAWAYHLLCLWPPLKEFPEKNWTCERCEHEPLERITKILHWRFVDKKERIDLSAFPKREMEIKRKPPREFFVLWAEKSYWKCSWVDERIMKYYFQYITMIKAFSRNQENWDEDEEEHSMSNEDEDLRDDPLYEKYYQNGVRPQWLKIHRILNERESEEDYSKMEYFVKWRDVPYSLATWESEDEDIPEFKKFITLYQEWRVGLNPPKKSSKSKDAEMDVEKKLEYKYFHPPPDEPLSDVSIPYEQQPSFIDTEKGLYLHDYQLISLNWLRSCWAKDTNTILADEMGLGKTIQAITFLYSLYKEGHSRGPFLITAPLSTINNWERELELWAPDFYVVNYAVYQDCRLVIRQHDFSWTPRSSNSSKRPSRLRGAVKFHVLLTSYEMISKDALCLGSIKWDAVVVDEAHRLKNAHSLFFRELNCYDFNYRMLMTGTPIQNNMKELFTLLEFMSPDKAKCIASLQERYEEGEDKNGEIFTEVHELLKTHMLRRVKEDVLKDLPTKSEIVVKVELSPLQKQYYKFILTKNFEALNSKNSGYWATLMMVFTDLQKCCNHPYLFSTAMMVAPVLPSEIYETNALVDASGKVSVLQKMLRVLKADGHRVLIFSHSTRMLDILEDFLEGEGYGFERIDGSVKGTERQDAIDRFNEPGSGDFVFLLSTKAGGLGINLASADTVILYDSDWNPHNDIQALSRSHRIGQTRKVMIYRFLTRDSLEERIVQVASEKLALNDVVMAGGRAGTQITYSKLQLGSMIRFGTEELFRKGDEKALRDNYTDEAIRDLLDRSVEAVERKENFLSRTDTYSGQVKVVSFVKQTENRDSKFSTDNSDPNYWQNLLGEFCKPKKEATTQPLGKRVKKPVSYAKMFDMRKDVVEIDSSKKVTKITDITKNVVDRSKKVVKQFQNNPIIRKQISKKVDTKFQKNPIIRKQISNKANTKFQNNSMNQISKSVNMNFQNNPMLAKPIFQKVINRETMMESFRKRMGLPSEHCFKDDKKYLIGKLNPNQFKPNQVSFKNLFAKSNKNSGPAEVVSIDSSSSDSSEVEILNSSSDSDSSVSINNNYSSDSVISVRVKNIYSSDSSPDVICVSSSSDSD